MGARGRGKSCVSQTAQAQATTASTIEHIRSIFDAADANGGGDLDEDEFISAFRGKLSSDDGGDDVRPEMSFTHNLGPT